MLESLTLSGSQRGSLERATASFQKNVDMLEAFLEPRGISREVAVQYRLGSGSDDYPGYERFAGWMSIPYLTPAGVVALKFRCVSHDNCKEEGCQRYDSPSGQKPRLYNAGALVRGGTVAAVVEGEFKALVVTEQLGVPAVATSAGSWSKHYGRCLADFDRVLVIADNDDAGMKHVKDKVLRDLPRGELRVPPKEHPKVDDWITEVGAETVRKAMGL